MPRLPLLLAGTQARWLSVAEADPVELTAGQQDLGSLCACLLQRPFISRSLTVPAVSFFATAYLFLDT